MSFAPGQTVQVDIIDEEQPVDVTGLIFHPDLIYGTPLAERMERYTFFNYAQSEALHLSDREQELLAGCLHNIEAETEHPVDTHSRELLCTHIELFLEYCLRFYDRQFCTRSKVNSDVLHKFEHELNDYFRSGSAQRQGAALGTLFCRQGVPVAKLFRRPDKKRKRENSQGIHTAQGYRLFQAHAPRFKSDRKPDCRHARLSVSAAFHKDVQAANRLHAQGIQTSKLMSENGAFRARKLKTGFQSVNPTWEQRKNMSDIFRNISDIF